MILVIISQGCKFRHGRFRSSPVLSQGSRKSRHVWFLATSSGVIRGTGQASLNRCLYLLPLVKCVRVAPSSASMVHVDAEEISRYWFGSNMCFEYEFGPKSCLDSFISTDVCVYVYYMNIYIYIYIYIYMF